MFYILVGMIFHETNTFSPYITDINAFKSRSYEEGTALVETYKGTKTSLGGFLDLLKKEADVKVIPSVSAAAEPSGIVTSDAFAQITEKLKKHLKENSPDAVLLALHGSMVTEEIDDADGAILEMVRKIVGNKVPIVATIDLHANLTERMVANATILVPYNEYPHADMYARGVVAANLLIKTLRGEIHPVMRYKPLPLLMTFKETAAEDYRPIRNAIAKFESKENVILASVLHSFFLSDTIDTRASTLAIAEDDKTAQQTADELAKLLWNKREDMVKFRTYTPEEAIEDAKHISNGLVVFADICDNPGTGSPADGTKLLKVLLDNHVKNVAYAIIADPETVEQCHKAGVGAYIDVKLGGKKCPHYLGDPIEKKAYVKTLSDGCYHNRGPMHTGFAVNLQKSAVIVIEGITIVVTSIAAQAYDVNIFESHGLIPNDYKIIVVKSSVHYQAAFGPMSKKMYSVECPGLVVLDINKLHYTKCARENYPFGYSKLYSK